MYSEIGSKIKGLAFIGFIVEAIGAIIAGIVIMCMDSDMVLFGLLTMIGGPIVAWVGSWILYAYGELVEATRENEYNSRLILQLLQKQSNDGKQETPSTTKSKTASHTTDEAPIELERVQEDKKEEVETEQPTPPANSTFITTEKNTIICSKCNQEQAAGRKVCWNCGVKFEVKE